MRALPDRPAASSLRGELSEISRIFRAYRTGNLTEEVQEMIHAVAMNPSVSQKVIKQVESGMGTARKKYIKICLTAATIFVLPIPITFVAGLVTKRESHLFAGDQIVGNHVPNLIVPWELAIVYFIEGFFAWRRVNGLAYVAHHLIRALEAGLRYYADPTNVALRDAFAARIQGAAIRYAAIFRKSASTRFFAGQVRSVARSCRNDIMSLIPDLVTAGPKEIKTVNENLTRLVIRSQAGYWHQTNDIAKPGTPLPRRHSIKMAFASFVADRPIQVAIIAGIPTLLAAILSFLSTHVK